MKIPIPCGVSAAVLKYGLAAVSAILIYIAFSAASMNEYDFARLHVLFVEQMEHVMMSLLLVVGGAVLLDVSLKGK